MANNNKMLTMKRKLSKKKRKFSVDKKKAIKAKALTDVIFSQMLIDRNGDDSQKHTPEFHKEYCERVCQLPTEDLMTILECAKKGLYGRMTSTIDAIETEITERELIKEESENGLLESDMHDKQSTDNAR